MLGSVAHRCGSFEMHKLNMLVAIYREVSLQSSVSSVRNRTFMAGLLSRRTHPATRRGWRSASQGIALM